jgi:serine/threonine-protein kinase HipA
MKISIPYEIKDTLYLWYLGQPTAPVFVGDLNLVMSARGVSLTYAKSWLQSGFALSDDLPLIDREHLPRQKDLAAGAVDDARPDRWGERVIRYLDNPTRLSLMELLFFTGDERFGALGVSSSPTHYEPRTSNLLPMLDDADALHNIVQKVLAGESIPESYRQLIEPGTTLGGARPKALICIEGSPWLIKFAEEGYADEPLVEHASMTLAAMAGITVAETRPIALASGWAVAVKRFDRMSGQRLHALSAQVALSAAGAEYAYPELAQLLRRRGVVEAGLNQQQMHELFRRLVFNILIDNTDDHEKNHALLMTDSGHLSLSPAFDVLPMAQSLAYQGIIVGKDGARSDITNAYSMCSAYGLSHEQATEEVRRVSRVVAHWQTHFQACGVCQQTLTRLSHAIDRPYLKSQRLLR